MGKGKIVMDHSSTTADNLEQAEEEILVDTISDEALEAAAGPESGPSTPPATWHYGFCC
jgi:hypothetical protein